MFPQHERLLIAENPILPPLWPLTTFDLIIVIKNTFVQRKLQKCSNALKNKIDIYILNKNRYAECEIIL